MDLVPGTVVERYTVESRLGTGGMAVVYLVRHNQLGTLHALKVLGLPTASVRRRLKDEGRLQGALRHPNIVAVTDMVDVDGCPALVMEYVAGPSLADLLADQKLTIAQADDLGRGILLGVEAAHRRGLVHRDVKPGNVLISVESGFPVPKIADFGLAKLLGGEDGRDGHTRSGATLGTPAYMAPEQVRDAKGVDHRADLFSLGAVLYELVTGTRAFHGADTLELLQNVANVVYKPIREVAPKAPKRMVEAIERALVADPAQRVQDCSALLALWTGGERRAWSEDAWDQVALFRMETLGSGKAARPPPSAPSEGEATFVLRTSAPETVSVDGATFQTVAFDPSVFVMAEGREVELTRRIAVATAPFPRELAAALGTGEAGPGPLGGVAWEQACELCNALSARTDLPPAYGLGDWTPRKAWSVDDCGRALYDSDLVPYERIGGILKAFGASSLEVLQHEPERLAEVDGIGAKTAKRVAAGWDRWRYYTRPVSLVSGATGWRLPTEAEWFHVSATVSAGELWEWTADADPGPAFVVRPAPLAAGRFVDPAPDQGPLRIVRRRAERGVRPPETRTADLAFRVVRTL